MNPSLLLPNPRSTALLRNARQKLRFVSVAAELLGCVPGQSPRDEDSYGGQATRRD